MRRKETFAPETKRPIRHKLLAMALSLLMLMNIAPEYGFGLAVRADETADYSMNLKKLQGLVFQRARSRVSDVPEAVRALLQSGEQIRDAEERGGGRIVYVAVGAVDNVPYARLLCYNGSDDDVEFTISAGDGLTFSEDAMLHLPAYTPDENEAPSEEGEDLSSEEETGMESSDGENNENTQTPGEETSEDGMNTPEDEGTGEDAETPGEESAGDEMDAPGEEGAGEDTDASGDGDTEAPDDENGEGDTQAPGGGNIEEPDGANGEGAMDAPGEQIIEDDTHVSDEESAGDDEEASDEEKERETEESGDSGETDTEDEEPAEDTKDAGTTGLAAAVTRYVVRHAVLAAETDAPAGEAQDTADGANRTPPADEDETEEDEEEPSAPQAPAFGEAQAFTVETDIRTLQVPVAAGGLAEILLVPDGAANQNDVEVLVDNLLKNMSPLLLNTFREKVKPGEEFNYDMAFTLPASPVADYGEAETAAIVTHYNNVQVVLRFDDADVWAGKLHFDNDEQGGAKITWDPDTLTLTFDYGTLPAASATAAELSFKGRMLNDGLIPDGAQLKIAKADLKFSFEARMPDGSAKDYGEQNVAAADLPVITAEANDEWTLSNQVSGELRDDPAANEVTVTYRVGVGLADGETPQAHSGMYDMVGRQVFGDYALRLSLFSERENAETVTPLRSTVRLLPDGGVGFSETEIAGDDTVQAEGGELTIGAYRTWQGTTNVNAALPCYSVYEVTAVYNRDQFTVPFDEFQDYFEQGRFKATAVAEISYNGKSAGPKQAEKQILFQGASGKLTIEKYVQETKSFQRPYDGAARDIYKGVGDGRVTFSITPVDDSGNPDNSRPAVPDVTIPNGNDYKVSVDVRPGRYQIAETNVPETMTAAETQTVEIADEGQTVKFVNGLQARGGLTFTKYGLDPAQPGATERTKTPLPGARFELFNSQGESVAQAESDREGKVTFLNIPAGEGYSVKEMTVPPPYRMPDDPIVLGGLTVISGEISNAGEVLNESGKAVLKLVKKVQVPGGGLRNAYTASEVGTGGFQFRIKNGEATVKDSITLRKDGNINSEDGLAYQLVTLDAYDESGNPISYTIEEVKKDGSPYSLKPDQNLTFTLTPGQVTEKVVVNTYTGSLQPKKMVQRQKNDTWTSFGDQFTLALYKENADGKLELVKELPPIKHNQVGQVVAGLDPEATYYWGETKVKANAASNQKETSYAESQYKLKDAEEKELTGGGTVEVVKAGVPSINVTPQVITNIAKKNVLMKIKKTDDSKKGLNKARFAIYPAEGNVRAENYAEIGNTGNDGWFTAAVAPGTYHVVELLAPEGYAEYVNPAVDPVDGKQNYRIVTVKEGETEKEVTFVDAQLAKLTIQKTLTGGGAFSGTVHFDVYRVENGNPVRYQKPVQKNKNIVMENVTVPVAIGKEASVYLPAGDYYLKETPKDAALGDNVIFPSGYIGLDGAGNTVFAEGQALPPKPIHLDTGTTIVTVENKTKYVALKVTKQDAITDALLDDAEILVQGNGIAVTGKTGDGKWHSSYGTYAGAKEKGVAGFVLPAGTYAVTEKTPPPGYANSSQSYSVELTVGMDTVTNDTDGKPLVFENMPLITVEGTKQWKLGDGTPQNQGGVLLALYKLDTIDKQYKCVSVAETAKGGKVRFEKDTGGNTLTGGTYYIVEAWAPAGFNPPEGKRLAPHNDPNDKDTDSANYQSIPADEIRAYHSSPVTFNEKTGTADPIVNVAASQTVNIEKTGGDNNYGDLTFTLTGTNGIYCTKLNKSSGTLTVPAGDYELTELLGEYGGTTSRYFGDTAKVHVAADGTVTVDAHLWAKVKDGTSNTILVTNPKLGGLTIEKRVKDENGAPLPGVTFSVEFALSDAEKAPDSGYNKYQDAVTGENGTIVLENLVPGWYKITETALPQDNANYVMDPKPQTVRVEAGKTDAKATFYNQAYGKLTLTKTMERGGLDQSQAPYPAKAAFTIKDKDDNSKSYSLEIPLTDNGDASQQFTNSIPLPPGTYTVTETPMEGWYPAGADGVKLDSVDVTVPEGGEAAAAFTNKPLRASVTIKKVDADSKTPLKGAEFALSGPGISGEMKLVTGDDGAATASFATIPPVSGQTGAQYTLTEKAAPSGYQMPVGEAAKTTFTILPGQHLKPEAGLTIPNNKGVVIELTKYDNVRAANPSGTISGASFTLYRQESGAWKAVDGGSKNTGADGKLTFDNLAGGTYALWENEADLPQAYKGYKLDSVRLESQEAQTAENGEKTLFVLPNLENGKTYRAAAYNRPTQTLTLVKHEWGHPDDTQHNAKYRVYTLKEAMTQEQLENFDSGMVAGLQYEDTVQAHSVQLKLQPGHYLVEETASDLGVNNDDPRTPIRKYIEVKPGENPTLEFFNLPAAGSLQLNLRKTVSPETVNDSLLNAGQTFQFTLADFAATPVETQLSKFVLDDPALTMFDAETGGNPVSANYAITEIQVGAASYKTYANAADTAGTQQAAAATLAVRTQDGEKTLGPVTLDAVHPFRPTGNEKWLGFRVEYGAQDGGAFSGFQAETVAFTAEVEQQKSENGVPVTPVRRIYNQATVTAQPVTGESATQNAVAEVKLPFTMDLPTMSLHQSSSGGGKAVNVGDTLEYTLSLTNHSASAPVEQPVIIDRLPKAVTYVSYSNGDLFQVDGDVSAADIKMSARNGSSENKYQIFDFNKALGPGQTFIVKFRAKVLAEALVAGDAEAMTNVAYATSRMRVTPYPGNEKGMSFSADKDEQNGGLIYAEGDAQAAEIDGLLGGQYGYGYLNYSVPDSAKNAGVALLTKRVTTDRESGYFDETVNARVGIGGTVTYRLTLVNNGSNPFKNIRIFDALPQVGDRRADGNSARLSDWGPAFVPGSVQGAVKVLDLGRQPNQAELLADVTGNTLAGLPEATKNSRYLYFVLDQTLQPKQSVTVTYTASVEAMSAQALERALYHLAVNDAAAVYAQVRGTNSEGQDLLQPCNALVGSNAVTTVLEPDTVVVGGDVWIDTNGDNIASDAEKSHADLDDALKGATVTLYQKRGSGQWETVGTTGIQKSGGVYSFRFNKLTATAPKDDERNLYPGGVLDPSQLRGQPPVVYRLEVSGLQNKYRLVTPYAGDENTWSRSNPAKNLQEGVGEKVSHFTDDMSSEIFFLWPGENGDDLFKNLGLTRDDSFTVRKVDRDKQYDMPGVTFALYGPFDTEAEITTDSLTEAMRLWTKQTDEQGRISCEGLNHYSYYVLEELASDANHRLDGATASGLKPVPQGAVEQTRAAWIVPSGFSGGVTVENDTATASLTVTKRVQDDRFAPDDLFTFQIEAKDGKGGYTALPVTSYTVGGQPGDATDGLIRLHANETALVENLPIGDYRVTETNLPAGYTALESAKDITVKKDVANAVEITNVNNRNGAVTLSAAKVLEGAVLRDGQFTFELYDANGTLLQSKTNTAQGGVVFDAIAYQGNETGTHTYTIREKIPPESERKGVTYDETVHTATVTVTRAEALATEVVYDKGQPPVFTNRYAAAGTLTLGAAKRVEGADLQDGQFTFVLKEDGGESQTARNAADGTITFAPITYSKAGEHHYTITEQSGSLYGYTYDTASYRVDVVVRDAGDGTLNAEATMDGKPFDPKNAEFVNKFAALSLDLYKYRQGYTDRAVDGAEFTLFAYDAVAANNRGTSIGSGTTADGGRLRFENLQEGRYILAETHVPSGYEALQAQYDVTIANDGSNHVKITLPSGERYASVRSGTLYIPNEYSPGGGGGGKDNSYRDDGDIEGGGGGGGGRSGGEERPLTRIPEPAVPLDPGAKQLTQIPDEDVPLGALPNTGGFSMGFFAVVGAAITAIGMFLKRNKKDRTS